MNKSRSLLSSRVINMGIHSTFDISPQGGAAYPALAIDCRLKRHLYSKVCTFVCLDSPEEIDSILYRTTQIK